MPTTKTLCAYFTNKTIHTFEASSGYIDPFTCNRLYPHASYCLPSTPEKS